MTPAIVLASEGLDPLELFSSLLTTERLRSWRGGLCTHFTGLVLRRDRLCCPHAGAVGAVTFLIAGLPICAPTANGQEPWDELPSDIDSDIIGGVVPVFGSLSMRIVDEPAGKRRVHYAWTVQNPFYTPGSSAEPYLLMYANSDINGGNVWPPTSRKSRMSPSSPRSEFPLEGAVEDGWKQGVEFGGGLGLQSLQRVHLRLQLVQFCYDPALLGYRGERKFHVFDVAGTDVWLRSAVCSLENHLLHSAGQPIDVFRLNLLRILRNEASDSLIQQPVLT